MSNEADMKAIDDYMRRTAPVTPEATALRSSWLTWYPTLSWWALNYDTSVRDEASTRRNKFNLANATTQAAKDQVINVFTNSHDVRGPVLPTGETGTQVKNPTPAAALKGNHPVIKQGSKGEAVKEWQRILGTTADGNFGPNTASLTKTFQTKKGLKADGVVGPATWSAALGSNAADAAPMPAETPSLLSSLNPFASSPSKPTVAQMPRPSAKPPVTSTAKPQPRPTQASPVKPSTPSAVASSGGSVTPAQKGPLAVAQAGMFGALDKVPLWVKIAGFVGAVGVLVFGRQAKMVDYSTGRPFKRSKRRAA